MRSRNRFHFIKRSYIYLIILILTLSFSLTTYASSHDRYSNLVTYVEETSQADLEKDASAIDPIITKDQIDAERFNGEVLDTVLFIIGIIALVVMLLEILIFAICKMFPSYNALLEKLNKIGIDGIADGYILAFVKLILPGIFAYLCLTGTLKQIIGFALNWSALLGGMQ